MIDVAHWENQGRGNKFLSLGGEDAGRPGDEEKHLSRFAGGSPPFPKGKGHLCLTQKPLYLVLSFHQISLGEGKRL